jgi:transcription elongation GreA/GreB family factor
MSRAFIREDVDPPERSGRVRSASGLPPGATNYITERGAKRLRDELANLRNRGVNSGRTQELERILESVTIVEPPASPPDGVVFGSTITIEATDGTSATFTIVGVDELDFEPGAVSWISPLGKALLAAELGDRIAVGEQNFGKLIKVGYRAG